MKRKISITIIILFILFVSIFVARFINPAFRYNFDVNFNTVKEHKSYLCDSGAETKVFTLPLPPSTAFAFKHSDSAVTYYSKLSYDEFLDYYESNKYGINGNIVTYNGIDFVISEVTYDEDDKYHFIDIDLYGNQ